MLNNETFSNSQSFTDSDVCYCTDTSNCNYPVGIYSNLTGVDSYRYYGVISPPMIYSKQLPGLYTGCMPFQSIMQSTLQCFYDQNCLINLFPDLDSIQILNNDLNDIYSIDTQIDLIIDQLFIENVSITDDFQLFYSECSPTKCNYSYNSRGTAAFIMVTLLSLMGGLFIILKYISILTVKFSRKVIAKYGEKLANNGNNNQLNESTHNTISSLFGKLKSKIREKIMNFNLFEQVHNEEYRRNTEILSTRIYLLLMIMGMIAIMSYATIIPYTVTYNVKLPSIDVYRQLIREYPSLTCECQQSVNNFSLFTSFSPRFHQFCSSGWSQEFGVPRFTPLQTRFVVNGFGIAITLASSYLQGRILCNIVKDIIPKSITAYLKTNYLSIYLTNENEFISSMTTSIKGMKNSILVTMTPFVLLMLNMAQGNQLLSGIVSNAKFSYNISAINEENRIRLLWTNPTNKSCQCGLSSDSCRFSYEDFCNHTFSGIPTQLCGARRTHVFIACEPMNGWLPTTIECFYNETCIRLMYVHIFI